MKVIEIPFYEPLNLNRLARHGTLTLHECSTEGISQGRNQKPIKVETIN